MVYRGKPPPSPITVTPPNITLTDSSGNRLLAYCFARFSVADFAGPDAQEDLGALVDDSGPVRVQWEDARQSTEEDADG